RRRPQGGGPVPAHRAVRPVAAGPRTGVVHLRAARTPGAFRRGPGPRRPPRGPAGNTGLRVGAGTWVGGRRGAGEDARDRWPPRAAYAGAGRAAGGRRAAGRLHVVAAD